MSLTKCEDCAYYKIIDGTPVCTEDVPFAQGDIVHPTKDGWPVVDPLHLPCGKAK
jgi:hypothetical protein